MLSNLQKYTTSPKMLQQKSCWIPLKQFCKSNHYFFWPKFALNNNVKEKIRVFISKTNDSQQNLATEVFLIPKRKKMYTKPLKNEEKKYLTWEFHRNGAFSSVRKIKLFFFNPCSGSKQIENCHVFFPCWYWYVLSRVPD